MSNNREQQFLYLTTEGWKTGTEHRIEIWFVSYADKYYIVSERKQKAHWVQNIIHNPMVTFAVSPEVFDGTAGMVDKHNESKFVEVSSLMHVLA